jgi:hypothetical protein
MWGELDGKVSVVLIFLLFLNIGNSYDYHTSNKVSLRLSETCLTDAASSTPQM